MKNTKIFKKSTDKQIFLTREFKEKKSSTDNIKITLGNEKVKSSKRRPEAAREL